jgi:hypothetical protein
VTGCAAAAMGNTKTNSSSRGMSKLRIRERLLSWVRFERRGT